MAAPPPLTPRPPAHCRDAARAPRPRPATAHARPLGTAGRGMNDTSAHGILGVVVYGGARTAWQLPSASGWTGGAPGQEAALALQSPEGAAPFQRASPSPRHPRSPPRSAALRASGRGRTGPWFSPQCCRWKGGPREPREPPPRPCSGETHPAAALGIPGKCTGTGCLHPAAIPQGKGRAMEEDGAKRINEQHKAKIQ